MFEHQKARSPFVFFGLTFAYSWIIWLPSILAGLGVELGINAEAYTSVSVPIGGFAPLVAAITMVARKHGRKECWRFIKTGFDFKVKPVYYLLAFLIPLIISVSSHYLPSLFGLQVIDTLIPEEIGNPYILLVPVFIFMLLVGGGQEEFGWRGYAQEPLQERFGIIKASLIIGFVWGIWHLPLWIMPGDGHSRYSFIAFVIHTIFVSVVYAWIYNASGKKMIVAWIFHGMANMIVGFFPYFHMIDGEPETAYWVYAGVNVLAGLIAMFLILQRKKSLQEA